MEYNAPENVIELAKSINTAIDSATKPLHTSIEKLVTELDNAYKLQSKKSQQIKRLIEALEHIVEYWNKDENQSAMSDALDEILNTAEQALKGE